MINVYMQESSSQSSILFQLSTSIIIPFLAVFFAFALNWHLQQRKEFHSWFSLYESNLDRFVIQGDKSDANPPSIPFISQKKIQILNDCRMKCINKILESNCNFAITPDRSALAKELKKILTRFH